MEMFPGNRLVGVKPKEKIREDLAREERRDESDDEAER